MFSARVFGGLLENFVFGIGSNDPFTVEANIAAMEYLGHVASLQDCQITTLRPVNIYNDHARFL